MAASDIAPDRPGHPTLARAQGCAVASIAAVFAVSALSWASVIEFSPGLLRHLNTRWGQAATERLQDWRKLVLRQRPVDSASARSPELERQWIAQGNEHWNRVPYVEDREHWGIDDYWATPVETLSSDGGDCEDYSIGKYFTLKELGVPIEKLRITYVRARGWNQPHMVLAYYPEPGADPLILDNLETRVLPASRRGDLEPVYSFNDEDLYTARANSRVGSPSQIRLWRDLLQKMEKERRM
jgi:predicted transglutaminase-like cysteine proteinase